MARRAAGQQASGSGDSEGSRSEQSLPERLHIWQIQAVRDALVVGAVFAIFWAGYALRAVTVPLLVALLLAYLFEPVIQRLCRFPSMTRTRAVTALLGGIILAIVIVLAVVVPLAVGSTMRLVNDVRSGSFGERVSLVREYVPEAFREQFDDALEVLPGYEPRVDEPPGDDSGMPPSDEEAVAGSPVVDSESPALTEEDVRAIFREEIDRREPDPSGWRRFARGGWAAVVEMLGMIVQVSLLAFLIPFYFFFFSLWYPEVIRFARGLMPEKNRERQLELFARMDQVISGFVRGRLIISIVMGVLFAIGWFICGVPYAITIGMVVGILSIVPYLGGVGIPIAVSLLLFDYMATPDAQRSLWLGWFGALLWPTLVFVIVQVIETYFLTPMIAGKATNLDPVTIVVAVLAGGSVLGVYGMLLAIPLTACLKILFTDVFLPKIRAWARGEAEDPLPIERE